MKETMHDVIKKLGIRECPMCGKEYTDTPALSRKDNKTEICPTCGTMEGLDAYINANFTGDKESDPKYCIFEKKICRYANKKGNTFSCEAPNDLAMTCK